MSVTTSLSSSSSTPATDLDRICSTETSNFSAVQLPTTAAGDVAAVELNLWSLLLLLFPVATAFGNALVCVSVRTERSLQTVTNYFIVSLAVADLMVALLVMPLAVYVEVSSFVILTAVVIFEQFILNFGKFRKRSKNFNFTKLRESLRYTFSPNRHHRTTSTMFFAMRKSANFLTLYYSRLFAILILSCLHSS